MKTFPPRETADLTAETSAVGPEQETFLNQLEHVVDDVQVFVDRAKERAAFRARTGRTMSAESRAGLERLRDSVRQLAGELTADLVATGTPEEQGEELARIHRRLLEDMGRGS